MQPFTAKKMPADDRKRWDYEAQIGFHTSFGSYLDAYRQAFDILFAQIEEKAVRVNVISYPLLFLARHSLELGYKLNINYLAKYSQLEDKVNWNQHFLHELHVAFGLHFRAVVDKLNVPKAIANEFNARYAELEKITKTFDDIDRGSFSFRYPADTEQKTVFKPEDTINLLDVKELYDKAMVLLFHTADVLGVDFMSELMEEERSNHDHA